MILGQAVGNLDVYAFLGYNTPAVLEELMSLRSDDHKNKRNVINQIVMNGFADLPSTSGGASSSLMKTFLTTMGLKVKE